MSETIRCRGCGTLLYFGEEIRRRLHMRAIPSEEAVLKEYGSTCPRCHAALSLDSVTIDVKRRRAHVAR